MRRPVSLAFLTVPLLLPPVRAQESLPDSGRPPALVLPYRYPPLGPVVVPALAPGGRLGPRVPAFLVAERWERRVRASLPTGLAAPPSIAPSMAAAAPAPPPPAPPPPAGPSAGVGALFSRYADIGMDLRVRFELKADQFRNLRCTAFDQQQALSGCRVGFPTITPNPQYAIRTAGVVGQRLHLNVDFDSEREFDANNNLQVSYEGLEDEILKRVQAGNVSFQAPPSRFISAAIPANNFGLQAIGQLGALEFRGIYAQQKGNVIGDRFYQIGATTSQPLDRQQRDLDYEVSRFFFVVDPAAIPGFPALDVLNLTLPDSLRVGSLHVYRVQAVSPTSTSNQNIGGVRAVACGVGAQPVDCIAQRAGPFRWEILQEGKDYYVDPGGAWFALANRLDQSDYLAVSYVTPGGVDSVGTFPVAANPDTTAVDTLRLVYDPTLGVTAASPSFRFEIRSAYRVGGQGLTRETMTLSITVNQRERTVATGETYLAHLGLAVTNDPNRFDEFNRLFPRDRDPQQGAPLRDFYVFFPHLTPFADSTRLTLEERNDSLYRTPRALLQTQGPSSVFTLQVHADVSASADRSTLSLNSFQVREGSERIYLGNQLLTREVDYTIDYAAGQVQFKNPDSLFQGGAAQVRVQFEERAAFTIAPTSIYGLALQYDLGARGAVSLTGMFQREQSAFTRPPLGFEPSSSFIGGLSTDLHFQPEWVTRMVDALPGVRTEVPSVLNIRAEVAVSKPSPNQLGQAYLEEFETEAGRFIPLNETAWHWGSIPSTPRGAEPFGIAPTGFDPVTLAALTWQSLPYNLDAEGRFVPVQFFPQQIDPTIRLTGQAQSAEPVLWILMKPDTVLGLADSRTGNPNWVRPPLFGPRWRSISQTLSPTGIDLSRVEFLEFWVWEDNRRVARENRTALLLDFGSVFEDALAIVPDSFTASGSGDTTYFGGRIAGAGLLDTERDPLTHSWSAALNDEGILSDRVTGIRNATTGEIVDTLFLCSATERGRLAPRFLGDLRSRCGRQNGAVDTEDQDGDFQLDSVAGVKTTEHFTRFVFAIGEDRYFVREGGMIPVPASQGGGAAGWRLYRIPFTDTLLQGQPDLRQVQSLRITVVTPPNALPGQPQPQVYFALSRVRLVGSSWLKRADTPIRGIAGERGSGVGDVIASVVSTENRDLGYVPPPGVTDEGDRRDQGLQVGATQINERSLRLLATGLTVGQRAEAFTRFGAEGDKNFLRYKQLRVWARGRGPGWEDGDLEFYIKAGKDENNFYLYHVPARTTSWEPEVVVGFDRWLTLRARVEQAWLAGEPPQVYAGCPDSTIVPHDTAYVMCDGPYLVHVRDPGTAPPNLAAVQELAAGMLRVRTVAFVNQAELWVDDIRLSDVVQDMGVAAAIDFSLAAADFADVNLTVTRRDGNFRQLGEDPSYITSTQTTFGGTVRLDRLLPSSWGLSAPLTVRYIAARSDPTYLFGTDLRSDALRGLRTPLNAVSSYSLAIRRVRPSQRSLPRLLVDPISLTGLYTTGRSRTSLVQADARSYNSTVEYALSPPAHTVPAVPAFLARLVRGIPLLGGTAWIRNLETARLRVSPSVLRFRSSLAGADGTRFTFRVPVADSGDALLVPARSLSRTWRNSASLDLLPLTGLQLRVDLASQRDLRDYGDSTTLGLVARQARRSLLGVDVGVETQRSLISFLGVTPQLAAWLRPRFTLGSSFTLSRDPNGRLPIRDIGDTAGAFHLPTAFTNSQRLDGGTQVELGALARGLFGDSAAIGHLFDRLTNVDLSWSRTRTSSFTGVAAAPQLGYQLGLSGFDGFRAQRGAPASAATQSDAFKTGASLNLPLGFRVTSTYQRTNNLTWVLRNQAQVPIRSASREWPTGTVAWSLTPTGWLSKALLGLTARLTTQTRKTSTTQAAFGAGGTGVRTSGEDYNLAPSVSLSWVQGVLTTFDVSRLRSEQTTAGNLYRTRREQQNASVSFAWRPPASLIRLQSDIRTTARYGASSTLTCFRTASEDACVPYVDSRQTETQLTLDTSFPPALSAGFQAAYVLSDERQINRKSSQLVLTAFVQLNTSVGQLR